MSGNIEILPPATQQDAPASGELERLSRTFTAAAEDVPATHTKIRLTDQGQLVGTIEVMHLNGGKHLVVGEQEWYKPHYLGEGDSRAHFAAVADRLLDEAVSLAERLGASLSSVTPGSLSTAERLTARGFRQAGDLWYREQPGWKAYGDVRFGGGQASC